jgi:hypothetical protein
MSPDPDAVPFGRVIPWPLLARPARTSAEASGATVSSGVPIMEHEGSPPGILSDSSLRTSEHGAAIVAEQLHVGQLRCADS